MEQNDSIGYRIRLIHNQVRRRMEAKKQENEGNLTGMQHWTLHYLKEHEAEEIYQRDLEEVFSVSRATASNMLQVMEREGLIVRVPVEHDARLKKLVLTERAQHMVERARQDVADLEREMTRGMDEKEVQALTASLDKILLNLE